MWGKFYLGSIFIHFDILSEIVSKVNFVRLSDNNAKRLNDKVIKPIELIIDIRRKNEMPMEVRLNAIKYLTCLLVFV